MLEKILIALKRMVQKKGDYNTGKENGGNWNTGDWNNGNHNTGTNNRGDWNTGKTNIGNCNTGDRNTGIHNTGSINIGNCNSGINNSGDWNTGNSNTGNHNTGSWNSGDRNTGYCNSISPTECFIFNKKSTFEAWDKAKKPRWMRVRLDRKIPPGYMSTKEKKPFGFYPKFVEYPVFYTSLKEAYLDAWERTTQEDRDLTRQLPNFDEEVFEEVFGFNPWKGKS